MLVNGRQVSGRLDRIANDRFVGGYAAYSFYQKNGRVPKLNELVDTVKTLTNVPTKDEGSQA